MRTHCTSGTRTQHQVDGRANLDSGPEKGQIWQGSISSPGLPGSRAPGLNRMASEQALRLSAKHARRDAATKDNGDPRPTAMLPDAGLHARGVGLIFGQGTDQFVGETCRQCCQRVAAIRRSALPCLPKKGWFTLKVLPSHVFLVEPSPLQNSVVVDGG